MAGSQITITGWLAKTPETRYTSNGQAVTTLTIPENHQRYNRDTKQWEDYNPPQTTWREITIWGTEAEWYAQQLQKGDELQITGTEKLEIQEGQNGEKYHKLKINPRTIAKILRPPRNQNWQQGSGSYTAPPTQNGYAQRAGTPQGTPQGNPAPHGNQPPQVDNWGQQSGGNYGWGNSEEAPF